MDSHVWEITQNADTIIDAIRKNCNDNEDFIFKENPILQYSFILKLKDEVLYLRHGLKIQHKILSCNIVEENKGCKVTAKIKTHPFNIFIFILVYTPLLYFVLQDIINFSFSSEIWPLVIIYSIITIFVIAFHIASKDSISTLLGFLNQTLKNMPTEIEFFEKP